MINPDGAIDCVLFLQAQREGTNAPSPDQQKAIEYLTTQAEWGASLTPEELVTIQQYFFPHAARRFFAYRTSDPISDLAEAKQVIEEGLAKDHRGGVLVRLKGEDGGAGRWLAVTAIASGQVTYFDPESPEATQTQAEAEFLARLAIADNAADFMSPMFAVAETMPPDAATGLVEPNTAIGAVEGRNGNEPIVVTKGRGVYPTRDMAKFRANQVATAGYEDAVIIREGLAYSVYAVSELRMGGQIDLKGRVKFASDKVSDLIYSSPHDKSRVQHLAF